MAQSPDNPPNDRLTDVSTDRRGFFRRILALGTDGVEQAGRSVAQRLAEALPPDRDPPPPAAPRNPPSETVSRDP